MDQQKIGKFIQEQRKKKKLTQEQLAEKLNITKGAVSKWERGLSLMDMSLLKPLSEILDVSIIEIINGEKIEDKEVKQKSEEAIEKTIKHSKTKEKKIKRKTIIKTIMLIFITIIIGLLIYKTRYIKLYSNQEYDKKYIEDFKAGYSNQKEMTIYKKTIDEDEYLIFNDIKIRNDFEGFIQEKFNQDSGTYFYLISEDNKQEGMLIAKEYTYIDLFTSEDISFFDNLLDKKFKSADRKYFLLRNDINNDIDFINYIKDHYHENISIFASEREIKEKYALNLFIDIVVPKVDSITIINGDYNGYIANLKGTRSVAILRNDKRYIFSFRGEKYTSDDYIKDILSTLEIK